ncbi:MAG TPA: 3'-5' exonuclease [Fodinibius sp.]|nr:3'-5' exonuclease [Fodinibius sp.]
MPNHVPFLRHRTTGLPKNWKAPVSDVNNWPRLVQLACLLYDENGNQAAAADYIIKPDGYTIPAKSSRVHGITNNRANEEGKPVHTVLQEFQSYLDQSSYLVAHNINFDEKIVGAEFLRAEMPIGLNGKKKICTMKKSTNFCAIPGRYGPKWPKLGELHKKLFGTEFKEAHNAAVDIQATAKCFWELKKRGIL